MTFADLNQIAAAQSRGTMHDLNPYAAPTTDASTSPRDDEANAYCCPKCGSTLEPGFKMAANELDFTTTDAILRPINVHENFALKTLFSWFFIRPTRYFRTYLCRSCTFYAIDYGTVLTDAEAKSIAKSRALL